MSATRRLAAILAADVVGYSRLMGPTRRYRRSMSRTEPQVINLMMDLQAELGIASLFIAHGMAVVERISHRVAT